MKKVLMLGNGYPSIYGLRSELVEALINNGHEVTVCFPNGMLGSGEETSLKYGCKFINISMHRRTARIFEEIKLIRNYYKIIKQEKPDVVLAYTVKCDVYGGIVCRLLNVPFMPNITGIGKGLDEKGIIQKILIRLYKIAVKKARVVFFQNEHDREFFINHNITSEKNIVLPGSGVNLEKYKPLDYPKNEPIIFLYNSRVMEPKGIKEFLEAARFITTKYPNTEFHVCGFCEYTIGKGSYRKIIENEENNGTIIYHGLVPDIINYYKKSHCIILPSYHPEGIANALLEAAACARPIITTNHPGCRETVNDGVTGFLIEPRNSKDLISKIEKFLSMTNEEKYLMGLQGRRKIEAGFDRKIVVDTYMREINSL